MRNRLFQILILAVMLAAAGCSKGDDAADLGALVKKFSDSSYNGDGPGIVACYTSSAIREEAAAIRGMEDRRPGRLKAFGIAKENLSLPDDKFLEKALPLLDACTRRTAAARGKNPDYYTFCFTMRGQKIEGDAAIIKVKNLNGAESEIRCAREGGVWKFDEIPRSDFPEL